MTKKKTITSTQFKKKLKSKAKMTPKTSSLSDQIRELIKRTNAAKKANRTRKRKAKAALAGMVFLP